MYTRTNTHTHTHAHTHIIHIYIPYCKFNTAQIKSSNIIQRQYTCTCADPTAGDVSKQTWSFLKSFLPVSLTTCADTGGSTSIPRTYIPLACTICCAFVSFITSSISAAQQAANKVILVTISHFLNNCKMKDVYSLIIICFSCACAYRSLPGQDPTKSSLLTNARIG